MTATDHTTSIMRQARLQDRLAGESTNPDARRIHRDLADAYRAQLRRVIFPAHWFA